MEEVLPPVKKTELEYVPYVPACVKVIEQIQSPPLLGATEGGIGPSEYEVSGLRCRVTMRFESDGGLTTETPLAMCRYLKPKEDSVFDRVTCVQCDLDNVMRERHNRFVVNAINEFLRANDCATSGGKITAPPPPIDAAAARLEAIKKLFVDKYDTASKAIKYLAKLELFCGRDYEFEGAFDKANDVAFEEGIKAKIAKGGGRVRVNISGARPCWWDGVGPRDESGRLVRWTRGTGHSFVTPELEIESVPEEPAYYQKTIAPAPMPPIIGAIEAPNPFDSIGSGATTLTIKNS